MWAIIVKTISYLGGVNSLAAAVMASLFRNRFADIRHFKVLSWWVYFMLSEPLPG